MARNRFPRTHIWVVCKRRGLRKVDPSRSWRPRNGNRERTGLYYQTEYIIVGAAESVPVKPPWILRRLRLCARM